MRILISLSLVIVGIGPIGCGPDSGGGTAGGPGTSGTAGAAGTAGTAIAANARLINASLSSRNLSCSRGASPGDRWCGLARPGKEALGELWVVNVSAIARGESARCDGSTPTCLKLADRIYGEVAYFHEDILFFSDENPWNSDTIGTQYIWRAGWTKARALTPAARSYCWVQYPGNSMACWENVASGTSTQTLIRQGALGGEDDGLLPEVGIIARVQGVESAGISAGGNYVIHDGMMTDASGWITTAGTFQIASMIDPAHPRLVAQQAYYPVTTSDDAAAFYYGVTGNTVALYAKTLPEGPSQKLVDQTTVVHRILSMPPMPGTQPGVLALTDAGLGGSPRDGGTIEWIQSNGERHEIGFGYLPYQNSVSPELKAVIFSSQDNLHVSSLDGKQRCLVSDKKARLAGFLPGTRVVFWQDSSYGLFASVFDGQCPRKQLDYGVLDWVVAPGEGLVYESQNDVKWIGLTDQTLASAEPKSLAYDISQFDYEAVSRVLIYVKEDSSGSTGTVYAMANPY